MPEETSIRLLSFMTCKKILQVLMSKYLEVDVKYKMCAYFLSSLFTFVRFRRTAILFLHSAM